MKQLLFLLLLPVVGFGQITTRQTPEQFTVGKVAPMGVFQSELTGSILGKDTMYIMSLRDGRYQAILELVQIHFKGHEKDELYKLMQSYFTEKDKKETEVNIGDQTIYLSGSKSMGTKTLTISKGGGGFHVIMEKQLKKLFGQ